MEHVDQCRKAYLRAVLDLINGSLVELARVSAPAADVESLLNTDGVALSKAAAVDALDPAQVSLDLCVRGIGLEGNDVLVGHRVELSNLGDAGRSSKHCREQSSKVESEAANASHCEQSERDTREDEAVWMRIRNLNIVAIV